MSEFAVSGSNWIPLNLAHQHDDNAIYIGDEIQYDTGHRFSLAVGLSGSKDFAINRKTLAYLSQPQTIQDFISEQDEISDISLITNSVLKSLSGTYVYVDADDKLYADGTESNEYTVFTFNFINDYVTIANNNKYMTASIGGGITFTSQIVYDTAKTQQFKYNYSNGKMMLFTNLTAFEGTQQKILSYGNTTFNFNVNSSLSSTPNVNQILDLAQFEGTIVKGFSGLSVWAKYFNDACDVNKTNFLVDLPNSYTGIDQNYLLISPYETAFTVNALSGTAYSRNVFSTAEIKTDFLNLKNVQTPEYELAEAPNIGNIAKKDYVKRRAYDKLFLGYNQDEGFENPFLSYTANTTEQLLKSDKMTHFHYPRSAPTIPLSAVGLIENGGIAGPTPFRSDKILKKTADYEKYSVYGDSTQTQTGVWLCAWLSGSDTCGTGVSGVWKDRYYNPGFVTFVDAATSYPVFIKNEPIIYDVDSEMIMDPGVLYQYFHMGSKFNETVVDLISAYRGLVLHYDKWDEIIEDTSPKNNDGVIANFDDQTVINSKVVSKDENVFAPHQKAFAYSKPNDYLYPPERLAFGGWVYADDWENIKGNQLIGNHYRGGYGISNTAGKTTPLVTVYDTTSSHFFMINSDGKSIKDKALTTFYESSLSATIVRDRDYMTWVFDSDPNNRIAHKIDLGGNIIAQVTFDPTVNFDSVEVDKDNNVWFLDTENQTISGLNSEGTFISGIALVDYANNLNIDKNSILVTTHAHDTIIDNNNKIWSIFGINLYDGVGNIVYHINAPTSTNPSQITCDGDNNIWILHSDNKMLKLSNEGKKIFEKTITETTTVADRAIDFTREIKNGEYTDFAWVVQQADNKIYKFDMDGELVKTITISNLLNVSEFPDVIAANLNIVGTGDFTGYQLLRKFDFSTTDGTSKKIVANLDLRSIVDPTSIKRVDLEYPTHNLSRGWHHFFIVYDYTDGIAKFYVNGEIVDRREFPATIYKPKYTFKNAVTIGIAAGTITFLTENLKLKENAIFDGLITDVRLYNGPISNSDIVFISRLKQEFKDLVWNMPTSDQNYIEEIERFFEHKLPGQKSQFYDLNIINSSITDGDLRTLIEDIIKKTVTNITPVHTELNKINWK